MVATGRGSGQEPPFWRRARWWRRGGIASLGIWGSTALIFLGTVLIARDLGPSSYGVVVLALAATGLVGTFLDFTFEGAVVHYGYRALAENKVGDLRSILRAAVAIDFGVGILVAAAMIIAAQPLADLAGGEPLTANLVRIAALAFFMKTLEGSTSAAILIAGRPDVLGHTLMAGAAARLAGVLIALQIGGAEAVLWSFVASGAVAAAIQGVVAWRLAWREWARAPLTGTRRSWIRRLAPFAAKHSVGISVAAAATQLVPVILGATADTATVGVFAVAVFPLRFMGVLSQPLRTALFPEQARLAAEGRNDVLLRSAHLYALAGLGLGGIIAVAGFFVLPTLLPFLYSADFTSAVDPARVLLIAAAAQLAYGWSKTFFPAIGRPGLLAVVSTIELALILVMMAIFASEGAMGAAIAVTATAVLIAAIWSLLAEWVLRPARRAE